MIHLNHIGIAVANLPEIKKLFSVLGMEVSHIERVPSQGVITHFLPLQTEVQGGHLELLEASDSEGTVAQFIRKRGPGIHHLSFHVEKGRLRSLCQDLREKGYRLVYDAPRQGAGGAWINFIHPASAGGMLIEIMEMEPS